MAKAPLESRCALRTTDNPVNVSGTARRWTVFGLMGLALAPLAAATSPQTDGVAKADGAADAIPVPLCSAGIAASKSAEGALALYDVGGGKNLIEWADAESAQNCAKALPGGLRLEIDDASLGLAQVGQGPLVTYAFGAATPRIETALLEPALCESYANVGNSPLSLLVKDTNGESKTLYGIQSLRYSLASGGLTPVITSGAGPLLRCHAVTADNAPLPAGPGDSLFRADFEGTPDLRVEFLDAQGQRLSAPPSAPADQFVNQPVASPTGVTYQVLVTNVGEGAATGVRVREFVPKATGSITPSVQTVGCGPNPQGTNAYCTGGNGPLSHDLATLAAGASQVYTITRKASGSGARTAVAVFSDATLNDDQNSSDNSRSLAINLINNQAPVPVGTIANVNQNEGTALSINTASAFSDPENNPLSYSATGLPTGISINTGTGVIGGLLSYTSAGVYNVTVTASDGGLTAQQAFTLTVVNQNGAPVVAQQLPDVTRSEGGLVDIQTAPGFSDPDGDALVYSATGVPNGILFIAGTGQIVGMLGPTSAGEYEITVKASDGALFAEQTFTLTVNNVNTAPTVTSSIPDQTSDEGELVSLVISSHFDDIDDDDMLTFSVTAGSLPPGLTLSAAGIVEGTISHTGVGTYTATITANDGNGGTVSAPAFDWVVEETNTAPVAEGSIAAQSATEGSLKIISAAQIDKFSDPDGDALTFSVEGLPAGLEMPDGESGDASIGGIPGAGTAGAGPGPNGEYLVTVTAEDPDGLTATLQFTLTVNAP